LHECRDTERYSDPAESPEKPRKKHNCLLASPSHSERFRGLHGFFKVVT